MLFRSHLLDRGDKPPDWEQLTSEERAALYEKFTSRLKIVAQKRRMPAAKARDAEEQFRKLQQQKAELLADELHRKARDTQI